MSRFVVHEHHSKRLHFDFRMEIEGVLRSWAVPKGPSMNPKEKRLAIMVKDHPIEYIDFEGIIPKNMYGAGPVVIWDEGEYDLLKYSDNKIEFVLHGKKLKGKFSLNRFRGKEENQWLLIKYRDEYSRDDWKIELSLTEEKKKELKETVPPCEAS